GVRYLIPAGAGAADAFQAPRARFPSQRHPYGPSCVGHTHPTTHPRRRTRIATQLECRGSPVGKLTLSPFGTVTGHVLQRVTANHRPPDFGRVPFGQRPVSDRATVNDHAVRRAIQRCVLVTDTL